MRFASLGLSAPMQHAATELGLVEPTPVQTAAIPVVLRGGDAWVSAPTGSGKTASFLLPALDVLHARPVGSPRPVRALVVVPTRELAAQTLAVVDAIRRHLPGTLKACLAVGGVSKNPQMMALRGGADVVIGTPGRLLDLVGQNALHLSSVATLVLDEADRLLSLGFADELHRLLALLPTRRQNLLFSATYPPAVHALAAEVLREPARIDVGGVAGAEVVVQRAIRVDAGKRTQLLRHLLAEHGWSHALVFVASGFRADHVAVKLTRAGIPAASLHGELSQGARSQALADFAARRVRVLVATDVASRGLDLEDLPAVVNYELPRSAADYVHRIGRTGRAGQGGVAVSFVGADDVGHLQLIEKRNRLRLPLEILPGFEPVDLPTKRDPHGGVKGKRKSKKDKLREARARGEG